MLINSSLYFMEVSGREKKEKGKKK